MLKILNNSCGTCTLCCTHMAVLEINKPVGQKCEHEIETGCSIYQDRPRACRDFSCSWLMDQLAGRPMKLDEKDRPQNTQVILALHPETKAGPIIAAYLLFTADKTYWRERLFRKLGKKYLVALIWQQKIVNWIGPQWRKDQMEKEVVFCYEELLPHVTAGT